MTERDMWLTSNLRTMKVSSGPPITGASEDTPRETRVRDPTVSICLKSSCFSFHRLALLILLIFMYLAGAVVGRPQLLRTLRYPASCTTHDTEAESGYSFSSPCLLYTCSSSTHHICERPFLSQARPTCHLPCTVCVCPTMLSLRQERTTR